MDRNRGGERDGPYGGGSRDGDGRRPSRFSDGPSPPPGRYSNNGSGDYGRRSPSNYRGGGRRAFVGPMGGEDVGGFRPVGGGGGFGPTMPLPPPPPMSGQKRSFSGRGGSPDRFDGGNFAKLFVGSVPRTATEGDIRPLFEAHGNVIEVALIKDKRTGQQQGCCFIKYATSEDADRAIKALHNQHTLPGGVGPIQVRYADGERERLGAVEHKLFVGSLNKQATVKEVEEIFLPYGQVDDVYLMRDEMKQSRGCGFVKYSHRDMALAAINALNGIYRMRGCDQPLTVRFADPKRPRPGAGDSRGPSGPAVGGPGFGPRFQGPGPRPGPDFGDPMGDHAPPNMWNPMAPQNLQAAPVAGPHGFGSQLAPRPGDLQMPFNQGFNQPLPQVPSFNQQISPLSKPFQSPQQLPPVPLHQQVASSYSQTQPSHTGQSPYNQPLPAQPSLGLSGQLPTSQPQFQQAPPSSAALQVRSNMNLQSNSGSSVANQQQQQLCAPGHQQMLQQPLQQSPSQLAQMLSQQTQTLQATFQSSQQAFSQLQQQLQMMQPSNPNATLQQNSQGAKQWHGVAPQQMVAATVTSLPSDIPPSSSHASTLPNQIAPVKCNWTEHTSPGGFKYYYNSITNESKWEKPEELVLFEQQQQQPPQQKAPILQPQNLPNPQVLPVQHATQPQQVQLQAQLQTPFQPHQLQQPSLSSGDPGYGHLPVVAGSVNDPTRFQGIQGGQEWMWKNKPAGA